MTPILREFFFDKMIPINRWRKYIANTIVNGLIIMEKFFIPSLVLKKQLAVRTFFDITSKDHAFTCGRRDSDLEERTVSLTKSTVWSSLTSRPPSSAGSPARHGKQERRLVRARAAGTRNPEGRSAYSRLKKTVTVYFQTSYLTNSKK